MRSLVVVQGLMWDTEGDCTSDDMKHRLRYLNVTIGASQFKVESHLRDSKRSFIYTDFIASELPDYYFP